MPVLPGCLAYGASGVSKAPSAIWRRTNHESRRQNPPQTRSSALGCSRAGCKSGPAGATSCPRPLVEGEVLTMRWTARLKSLRGLWASVDSSGEMVRGTGPHQRHKHIERTRAAHEHKRAKRWTALLFSSSKPKPSELQLRKDALLRRTPRPCLAQAPLPLPISLASRISATAPFFKNPLAGPLV